MRVFAKQQKSVSDVKSASPVNTKRDISARFPVDSPVRSICPCGGGCPACSDKHFNIQKKSLAISSSNDADEIEADRIARRVVDGQPAEIRETGTAIARSGSDATVTGVTTPEFHSSLENSKGGGRALDDPTRSEMETKMGADFSGVRIHTGTAAHKMNEDVSARAFTHGQDIFFRQGEFNTASRQGKELLAHELVHTVQQTAINQRTIARQQTKQTTPKVWTKDLIKKEYFSVQGKEGGFIWVVNWHTNQNNGWIVQKIEYEAAFTDCGGDMNLKPDLKNTKTLWEAWPVINGKVTGGQEPGTDGWVQGSTEAFIEKPPQNGHKGMWKTKGTVYFVDKLSIKGWKESDGVWTTYTDPKITTSVLFTRKAGGKVSCCGKPNTWYHKPIE